MGYVRRMPASPRRLRATRLLIADLPNGSTRQRDGRSEAQNGGSGRAQQPPHGAPDTDLGRVLRPLEALGVEILVVHSLKAAEAALKEHSFDVMVIEARAVGKGGPRPWNSEDGARATPVLLVADPDDPIPAVVAGRALRGSLWDLVHRDAPPEEVLLRVERIMDQFQLLEDLDQARYHASHDDRTGLLRPLRFDARLREHFSAAQRHRLEMALVLIDLDGFGLVNKCYDHTVGDELIARAGSVIRMSLRTEDVGARIGGDEFALILPYTQRVDAARVVTRFLGRFRALSGPPPQRYRGHAEECATGSIAVSASIGFETYNGADLHSPEELRHRAERALRTAKERGGNQGVYHRSLIDQDEGDEWPAKILRPQPPPEFITGSTTGSTSDLIQNRGADVNVDADNERLDSFND